MLRKYVSDLPIYVYVCFGCLCLETDQNWQHRGENVGEAQKKQRSRLTLTLVQFCC